MPSEERKREVKREKHVAEVELVAASLLLVVVAVVGTLTVLVAIGWGGPYWLP